MSENQYNALVDVWAEAVTSRNAEPLVKALRALARREAGNVIITNFCNRLGRLADGIVWSPPSSPDTTGEGRCD